MLQGEAIHIKCCCFFFSIVSRLNWKKLANVFKFQSFPVFAILSCRWRKLNSVYKQSSCKEDFIWKIFNPTGVPLKWNFEDLGLFASFYNFLLRSLSRKRRMHRQQHQQRHRSLIWLVEWGTIIALHVRHAFWCNVLTQSAKRRREIFIFEVLTTAEARSRKSFFLCRYMNTIRAKQAKVYFAYFVERDQHGIISKHLS